MIAHSRAADKQFLLIGPWRHDNIIYGGKDAVGELRFAEVSVLDFDDFMSLHVQFFDHFMKSHPGRLELPRARIYVTGSNRWRNLDAYPPPDTEEKRLYLHSTGKANTLSGDGTLSWDAPLEEPPDHYTFDPRNPISHMIGDVMHGFDNRSIEKRRDVLVYTSEALKGPLEVIGQVVVELYAASDAKDTDFIARLLDVHPDGRALNLGSFGKGFIRARYRKGYRPNGRRSGCGVRARFARRRLGERCAGRPAAVNSTRSRRRLPPRAVRRRPSAGRTALEWFQ